MKALDPSVDDPPCYCAQADDYHNVGRIPDEQPSVLAPHGCIRVSSSMIICQVPTGLTHKGDMERHPRGQTPCIAPDLSQIGTFLAQFHASLPADICRYALCIRPDLLLQCMMQPGKVRSCIVTALSATHRKPLVQRGGDSA